jgi:hypothetical protein
MTFLGRLRWKRPPEVRASLDALDASRPLFSKLLYASLVLDRVKTVTMARDAEAPIIQSISAGNSARDLVLHAIVQAAKQMLSTGQYHIYRGVLGMEGNDIRAASAIALDELIKSGFADEAEAKEQRDLLSALIASVG